MRIMTAMYTFRRGGAYDRFRMMVESLLERHCEVYCLSLTPIDFQNSHYHNCIPGPRLRNADGWLAKMLVLSIFPVYALWVGRQMKVELLVAFGSLYAFLLALAKWILNRPMVTLIRGDLSFGLKMRHSPRPIQWISQGFEYLGLVASDRIVTVNTATRETIRDSLRWKKNINVQVLHNNIPSMSMGVRRGRLETKTHYGIPMKAKVIVTAGVINPGKNVDVLIRCLPGIGRDDLYLLIVGEGAKHTDIRYLTSLKELTEQLRLRTKVLFLGWLEREELWQIFHAADLFILPSKNEGMPNVMLEALGCDLPCLGSNVPGVKDILQYDELLFDPCDQESLTRKIENILLDQHSMENVKRLCQERREVFSFDWGQKLFEVVTREVKNPHEEPLRTHRE